MANIYSAGTINEAFLRKYTALLDRKYVKESITAMFESTQYDFTGFKQIFIPEVDTHGMGNYDVNTGYPQGQVRAKMTPYTLKYDRSIKFSFEVIEAENVLGPDIDILNTTINRFMETRAVPEIDAVRIARIAEYAGVKKSEDLDITDIVGALDQAFEHFADMGYDKRNLMILIHPKMATALKQDTTVGRKINVNIPGGAGLTMARTISQFDGVNLQVVPSVRFWNKLDLLNAPVIDQFTNTWNPATDARMINFILMPMTGVAHAITRHKRLKSIHSDVNQQKDDHILMYRVVYDLLVPKNQRGLIYTSIRKTK